MKKKDKIWISPSCREYAKLKGVEIVGKLKMHWYTYGDYRNGRYWEDEAGTKYYPSPDYPTLVLPDGTIK
jgi:hypothetical protein